MKVTTPANNIPRPGYDLIFNDLAGLAVRVCGGSIAFLCSIDAERQWGEFNAGDLNPEVFCGTTFYSHAIEQAELFNISDASADARFTHNPLIVSGSPVRFFAGVPLRSADGHALGMVSILDSTPRRINDKQLETLLALAREASAHLEDRRNITDLKRLTSSQNEQSEVELLAPEERFFKAFDASPEPMTITKYVDGRYLYVNRSFVRKSGYSQKEIQINGDSLVAIESSRFENNINYGIEVTGSARVTIAKSEVHATGFRLNPVYGRFPNHRPANARQRHRI